MHARATPPPSGLRRAEALALAAALLLAFATLALILIGLARTEWLALLILSWWQG